MNKTKDFIPPKRKKTHLKAVKTTKEIPEDLAKKWNAVQACATAANLIQKGHFTLSYMTAVNATLGFLIKLHEQSVEECLKHPDAALISDLKEALKQAAKNAKTQ